MFDFVLSTLGITNLILALAFLRFTDIAMYSYTLKGLDNYHSGAYFPFDRRLDPRCCYKAIPGPVE